MNDFGGGGSSHPQMGATHLCWGLPFTRKLGRLGKDGFLSFCMKVEVARGSRNGPQRSVLESCLF